MLTIKATRLLLALAVAAWGAVGGPSGVRAQEMIGVDAANPPFMYEADSKAAGIYPALIDEIFKRLGTTVKIQALPWKRALSQLDAGEGAVGGIYKNEERLKKYDYTDVLFDETILVYAPKGKTFPFNGPESLKDKAVGVLFGWSYGDAFDKAKADGSIKAQEVASDAQNFVKLTAGRIDVLLAIKESAALAIASEGLRDKVEVLSPPFAVSPAYIAFAKKANKGDLIARINGAITAMRQDGSFDKIVSAALSR